MELVPMMNTTTTVDILTALWRVGKDRSWLVPSCQRGYRWCALNDQEKSRCCDKVQWEKAHRKWMTWFLDFSLHLASGSFVCKSLTRWSSKQSIFFDWKAWITTSLTTFSGRKTNYGLQTHSEVRRLSRGTALVWKLRAWPNMPQTWSDSKIR